MPKDQALIDLYAGVTTCNVRCQGVENQPAAGKIGRGFYCPFDPSGVSLLLVSKNPGISKPEENRMYVALDGLSRVTAHEEFGRKAFHSRTSRYHLNIVKWVAKILDVEATHDAVFEKAAMTALVKCHSASDKTASLPPRTKTCCSETYLFREIELIQPKYLLALGTEPYHFLDRPEIRSRHRLPVGKLWHPSWSNMKGGVQRYEEEELPKIGREYRTALGVL